MNSTSSSFLQKPGLDTLIRQVQQERFWNLVQSQQGWLNYGSFIKSLKFLPTSSSTLSSLSSLCPNLTSLPGPEPLGISDAALAIYATRCEANLTNFIAAKASRITDTSFSRLLTKCKNLKELVLDGANQLTYQCSDSIASLKEVEHIWVRDLNVSSQGWTKILKSWKSSSTPSKLKSIGIHSQDFTSLYHVTELHGCTSIEELELGHLDYISSLDLIHALEGLPNLRKLILTHTTLTHPIDFYHYLAQSENIEHVFLLNVNGLCMEGLNYVWQSGAKSIQTFGCSNVNEGRWVSLPLNDTDTDIDMMKL